MVCSVQDGVLHVSGEFIPDVWSKQLLAEFQKHLALQDVINLTQVVLRLGPEIAMTVIDLDRAIADPQTDPIMRDAMIAYKVKLRITSPPELKITTDKIYGVKTIKP